MSTISRKSAHIDKRLVAKRFAKARNSYEQEAFVQRRIARQMLDFLKVYGLQGKNNPRHIVELGCGTGIYSRMLFQAFQPETLLLNDLCPEMEEFAHAVKPQPASSTSVRFCPGDGEKLDLPLDTDLITSCSTLQWFDDIQAFLSRCQQALVPGGLLAFSTFGPDNLHEIRHLTGYGLQYLPMEHLLSVLSPSMEILHAYEETLTWPFQSPMHVLRHLQRTGVTGTGEKKWTREQLQRFCNDYIHLFGTPKQQVELTYHPIYVIAQSQRK